MKWYTALSCIACWMPVMAALQVFRGSTETAHFTSAPLSVGSVNQLLIPFNVDYLSVPNYTDPAVLDKYCTSAWDTSVAVYDNGVDADTYLSMSWRQGQGPGASAMRGRDRSWSACVVAIPGLLDRVTVTGKGNGSCFDVAPPGCLYGLQYMAQVAFAGALGQVDDPGSDYMIKACEGIHRLPISPGCWANKTDKSSNITVYSTLNPTNNQPFLIGIDEYGKGSTHKKDVLQKAQSRPWTFITLEAQGKQVITTAMTCPYAGMASASNKTPSPDGTCGGSVGYSCRGTSTFFGNCCGPDGLCGWTEDKCGDIFGCQPQYGLCDKIVVVTAEPTTPTSSSVPSKPTTAMHIEGRG